MFRGSVTSPRSPLTDMWLCQGLSGPRGQGHSFLGSCLPPARPLRAPAVPPEHPCLATLLCRQQQDRLVFFGLGTWRSGNTLSCLEARLSLEQSHSLPSRCWWLQKVVPDPVLMVWTDWRRGGSAEGQRVVAGSLDGGQFTCRAGLGVNKWFNPAKRPWSPMPRCS